MAESTSIEWCDATFNPWWGCQKVSPACDHCYAERDAARFSPGRVLWGVGAERRTFDEKHWQQPLKWARRAFVACPACGWRGMHTKLNHDNGSHRCPTCGNDEWRPARQRVFCASMGDWLDLDAPLDQFVRLLDTIRRTPELDWLLLSKRIGNWRKRLAQASCGTKDRELFGWMNAWLMDRWVPPNVWIGATVVNQDEADRDVPKLLAVPARVRFLSIEPMLAPVRIPPELLMPIEGTSQHGQRFIDWIICGGESGPHARPMHPDWARGLRDQCAAAGVPFLHKQNGEWLHEDQGGDMLGHENSPMHQWPADGGWSVRVGKKAAGRLLDGRTHDEFPLTKLHAAEQEAREPSLFPPT